MLSSLSTGTELRRFRRGVLPKLAVVAMLAIPLLYGALYLWAYWDPTGNLDRLPVALVNADEGATRDGEPLHAGDDVVDELLDSDALDWRQVDADEAAAGVTDGTYYFAVTLPGDFSTDIASIGGDAPTSAEIDVTYNDANSYLASTLGRSAMTQIRAAVSATIGEQAADQVLVGLGSARDGFAQASDGALTLTAASGDLSSGAHQVADGATSAADGAARLSSGAADLASGAGRLDSGAATLATGAGTLSSGASTAASGAADLADGAQRLAAGASDASTKSGLLAAGAQQLSDGVDKAATTLGRLSGASTGLGSVATNLTALAQEQAAAGDTDAAQRIQAQLQAMQTTLADLGLPTTADGQAKAAADLRALVTGAHDLRDGSAALSSGLGTLSSSTAELASGAGTLASGTAQVAAGASDLAGGAGTLASGASDLDSGAQTLASGAADLASGTGTLASGATQVADGSDQLGDGSQELADKLADGAAQIPDDSDATRSDRASALSTPVGLSSTDVAAADGYGEGFAPFFVPLALFVGGLITWLLLRPLPPRGLATPARGWRIALAGYLPALAIGVGQVVILLTVVHFGLGLGWSTALGTAAFTVLVAGAFLAVQQMLIAVLGAAAGKVAIIALLMLQLTAASGTYPVETTPAFFRALHPALPMTYAVTGLRELTTGGTDARLWTSVAALAAFLLGSLAITSWRAARQRTWTLSRLHPALSI
ncbi:YhgE/Pip domain-containing protein [Cellulomonas sp. PS-H5]|uniref:YhgE/Pip domain-containing protein n=1 Tax=Cellulomonas sp. PS-H5 TaxID=2820400 RepID=UPI001C4EDE03|nr:YhgE/Pip domain-containing protein [Cellulomonas sp. PS-H5]MBW0254944.1 YhgE/Pip domain-containing protein [Cellulomonas sp. PS-H5]